MNCSLTIKGYWIGPKNGDLRTTLRQRYVFPILPSLSLSYWRLGDFHFLGQVFGLILPIFSKKRVLPNTSVKGFNRNLSSLFPVYLYCTGGIPPQEEDFAQRFKES